MERVRVGFPSIQCVCKGVMSVGCGLALPIARSHSWSLSLYCQTLPHATRASLPVLFTFTASFLCQLYFLFLLSQREEEGEHRARSFCVCVCTIVYSFFSRNAYSLTQPSSPHMSVSAPSECFLLSAPHLLSLYRRLLAPFLSSPLTKRVLPPPEQYPHLYPVLLSGGAYTMGKKLLTTCTITLP